MKMKNRYVVGLGKLEFAASQVSREGEVVDVMEALFSNTSCLLYCLAFCLLSCTYIRM